MSLFSTRIKLLLVGLMMLPLASPPPALSHGSHGGGESELEAGEFDFTPIVTIEAHGGFDTNLEGDPKHYALDGLVGGAFSWGLGNGATLSIEAAIGPSLVWGEAEHFYGKVHVHDHGSHDDHGDHDDHGHDDHDDHDDHGHDDHADHDDHGHDDHADHDDHGHDDHHDHDDHGHDDHGHSHDTDYKRTDVRGFIQVRYAPNDRLNVALSWNPYYVTRDQGDDIEGLKNELSTKVTWALGDGDVNFALGDGLSDVVDGVFLSVDHRQGWESDGMWVGNYTDPRIGFGFNYDQLNVTIDAGPRFYVPGSYSGLSQRTDFAAEISLSLPVGENADVFAHWQQAYSWEDAPGWGDGWQHHIGTGVSFTF